MLKSVPYIAAVAFLMGLSRKPEQLLAFAELKAGDRVADFMPGNGYFTRIMSDVVGAKGHVYAFLPKEQLANCAPSEVAGSKALERDPSYVNVSVLSAATANFNLTSLDVIWTAQNYHDLHDSFMGPANCSRAESSLLQGTQAWRDLLGYRSRR